MAHPDVHSLFGIDQLQKAEHSIVVVQRLSDAHQNDVGHRQSGIYLCKKHLVEHFRRRQPPHKPAFGRGAEGAAHRAADLRGDADGIAVVVAHQDAFDAVAVGQPPEVFDRAVLRGDQLACHRRRGEAVRLRQPFTQGFGEIRHLVEAPRAAVHPLVHLSRAEGRFAHGGHLLRQLGKGHGFNVFHGFLLSLQMKNPSVPWSQGSSVVMAPSGIPEFSGKCTVSAEYSGCSRKNASATSSFSRRRTVQVL